MARRRRDVAPLWVYFFGLFAFVLAQRLVLPPDEHSTAVTAAVLVGGAVAVIVAVTVAQRRMR